LELNTFGPRLDGVAYPDTYKMDATLRFLQYLLAKPGVLDICCRLIDDKLFGATENGASSYAETFHQQMMSDYYMELVDLQETSPPALERIFNTLHAKICFAEIFLMLLQHQLKTNVAQCHLKDSYVAESNLSLDYHTLPIIRDILSARRGSKDSLENVTKSCASLWSRFGAIFLYGSHGHESHEMCNDIRQEILRLADHLGAVISYHAWLYGREMNEDAYALAEIVGRVFEREMEASNVKAPPGYESMHESIKMRFLSTIRKEYVPQLRPRLAERFCVVELYNRMYGF
jgi:hypothetical protein